MKIGRLCAVVAVLAAAAGAPAAQNEPSRAEAEMRATPSVVTIDRHLLDAPPDARTRAAFRAAFGRARGASVRRGERFFDFRPLVTVDLGSGRIALLSAGTLRDASHGESGMTAIHYLAGRAGHLRVTGRWFGLGARGSHGGTAGIWGVSRAISRWPVLYTEGGGTFQGITVSQAVLTEFQPRGPVDVARFGAGYSTIETQIESGPQEIYGIVTSAVRDRSFIVRYVGSMHFQETYVRVGDHYRRRAGASRMPEWLQRDWEPQ